MCDRRYSLGQGLLLLYKLHWKSPGGCVWYACMNFTMKALAAASLGLQWSSIMITLYEVMLWLCCGCCYGCCISKEGDHVMAAMPARRE